MPFEVDPDISRAKTISTQVYLDPEIYRKSKEKIFARSWQFIGDSTQVREAKWVTPVDLLPNMINEPLLLTRDENGSLHCLSNVCTHRGNILVEKACRVNDIRCCYHGRRFRLNGEFLSMPEFKEVQNFPSADDNLHQLPLHQWGPWLFTSLNGSDAAPYFEDMAKRLSWMDFSSFQLRPELSRDYNVGANWALYCENYLEGFHIPFVHSGLNAVLDYGNYSTELYRYSNLQLGIARDGEMCFDLDRKSVV